jgi:hypothetical protein
LGYSFFIEELEVEWGDQTKVLMFLEEQVVGGGDVVVLVGIETPHHVVLLVLEVHGHELRLALGCLGLLHTKHLHDFGVDRDLG